AGEEEYLRLLGLLNSSTACFWLKQVSHSKGNATASSGMPDQPWSWNYEFTGTKLEEFPLPAAYPLALAVELDSLAQQMACVNPAAIALDATPAAPVLREGKVRWESTRGRMIAFQEELDWRVYSIYGLHAADLSGVQGEIPELEPGQRAFEIALARKIESGEVATKWFTHH